jgi:hemerythrin-like domain-containing protein
MIKRNCCYTLKDEEFPTMLPMIKEHRFLEDRLIALKDAIDHFDLNGMAGFINFYHEKYPAHTAKEEQVLFLLLSKYVDPKENGKVAHLIKEHRESGTQMEELESLLWDYQDGAATQAEVQRAARKFHKELCCHTEDENFSVIPWAEELLTPEDRAFLHKRWKQIGYIWER